jgi:hypothetical protein
MGSLVYDFLHESVLFDPGSIETAFASLSETDLQLALREYREFVLDSAAALEAEARELEGAFKVFTSIGSIDVAMLRQCAWYVSHFVVDDPLFRLSAPRADAQEPLEQFLGLKSSASVDRQGLVDVLRDLRAITPMVAANYVKFLPVSRLFEVPRQLPITYSPTGFVEALPAELMGWLRERASVRKVELAGDHMVIPLTNDTLEPCRIIAIQFGSDPGDLPFIFQLFQQRILGLDEATGTARFAMTLPDTPPDVAGFDAWVKQSINQAARSLFMRLMHENAVAYRLGAEYLTTSGFAAELMQQGTSPDPDIRRHTANTLLNLEVPFAPDASIERLMDIRVSDGEAFQDFRIALEKQFRELQLTTDADELRLKAGHAVHELTEVQLRAVTTQVRRLAENSALDGVIGAAGLGASFLTGGLSLVATAIAGARGLRSWHEYQTSIRQNPAFFLWRVLDR